MNDSDSPGRVITPQEARRVYDRIGRFQDWLAFYEGPAVREMLGFAAFHSAKSVLEFGCGTGAFGAKLMEIVPADCRYVGIDISPNMVRIARSRLAKWAGRTTIHLTEGSPHMPESDGAFDRFVSNYVFDLLAPEYIAAVLDEAHRVLTANGKLCVVSLGHGSTGLSRIVTSVWEAVWKRKPEWVGGCRPLNLRRLLPPRAWKIEHHATVVAFGVASEVLIACPCSE